MVRLKEILSGNKLVTKRFFNILIEVFVPKNLIDFLFLNIYSFLALQKVTAQKIKFYIKDFFNKYLLKKSLLENFIFCAVVSVKITSISIKCSEISVNVSVSQNYVNLLDKIFDERRRNHLVAHQYLTKLYLENPGPAFVGSYVAVTVSKN